MDLDENIPEIKELQQLEISKEHIRLEFISVDVRQLININKINTFYCISGK